MEYTNDFYFDYEQI